MKKIIGISLLSMFCYGGVITNLEGVNPSDKLIENKNFDCEKEIYKKFKLKDPKNDSFEGYLINVTEKPRLTYKELEEGRAYLLDYLNENNEKELAEELLINFRGPTDIKNLEKYCNEYKEVIKPKMEKENKIEIKEIKKENINKVEENNNNLIFVLLGGIFVAGSLIFRFKNKL